MHDDTEAPLARRLPPLDEVNRDDLLDRFLDYVSEKGVTLYAAQEEAILEIFAGKNVILNTPTGSGKSLVALALHFLALAENKRSIYTSPIKALASEKFFSLCKELGANHVGMLTGDAAVNRDAPILCCTAEVLANMALREGKAADADYVIMDEFHYYADRDRGAAWQVPLLTLPQTTFLLMSATLGKTDFFEAALSDLNGKESVTVRSDDRPVPLDYTYRETALHETIDHLITHGKAPVYIVSFTQRACAEEAQNLMSTDFCTKEQKRAIADALVGFRFDSPYGKDVQKYIRHGIGLHHAGLLPKYRLLVEKLAQEGLLRVICGTDTLGVGVNIPIRSVLFTKLCKFDGEKTTILSVRDFKQISGRAGRKGFDTEGSVVAQAPEHVIENLKLEAKAAGDKKKSRKLVRRKPPDRGYVHWDKTTFERLVSAPPEPLSSSFKVTHGMLLNVLGRPQGGCQAMKKLLSDVHEHAGARRLHKKTALSLFRSLVQAGIIELVPVAKRDGGPPLQINADLQEDFSIHHALSLYLFDTLTKVDVGDPAYELDLLTLVESILENPTLILQKQLDRIKSLKMAEMKAAGVEYDDRIAELEKLDYPKPQKDFIYDTFNAFAKKHPWVGEENIRPKSVAREMYEMFLSFSEYIKEYGLERAEGLLLRYLSDVYKALVQTVPSWAKTEATDEVIVYFGQMVRGVDSSLLDEWERMREGGGEALLAKAKGQLDETPKPARDITRDEKGFTVLVRNAMFQLLRALSLRDYEAAAAMQGEALVAAEPVAAPPEETGEQGFSAAMLEAALSPFFEEHAVLRTDPKARVPSHTIITHEEVAWRVSQVMVDEEDANDWVIEASVDLSRSREAGRAVFTIQRVGT